MSLDTASFYTHRVNTYQGNSTITFDTDSLDGLKVIIQTPNLLIRSVTQADYPHYARLYGDENVMKNFANGTVRDAQFVAQRIAGWVKRWRESDPYSGFAVFHKNTGEFLGHIVLGHGDEPGISEVAGLGHKESWGKKYGTEAAIALVQEYAPATVKEGYQLEGKPLEKIVATSKLDNTASNKILAKLLHKNEEDVEQYGAQRHAYTTQLNEIQAPPSYKTERSFQLSCLGGKRPEWMQQFALM